MSLFNFLSLTKKKEITDKDKLSSFIEYLQDNLNAFVVQKRYLAALADKDTSYSLIEV